MLVRDLTIDVVRSFRVILALVPFLLFLLALIGFLNLEEIWRSDVAPELKKSASEAGTG